MKIVTIEINTFDSPGMIKKLLDQERFQKGDKLNLNIEAYSDIVKMAILLMVVHAMALHFKFGDQVDELINETFHNYESPDDLEEAVETLYNVDIEMKGPESLKNERSEWIRSAMENFGNKYDEKEEDISDLQVSEPNPNFSLNG